MSIWPTNQATSSRRSYGAAPTNNSDLDWSYTLPGSPAVTGSVTVTFTYDADVETWVFHTSGSGAWDGSDGSPAPGCVVVSAAHNGPHFDLEFGEVQTTVQTWEDYGVPPGAVVTGVEGGFRFRETSESGSPATQGVVFDYSVWHFVSPISFEIADLHQISYSAWSTSWQQFAGGVQGVSGTVSASTTPIFLQVLLTGASVDPPWQVNAHFDTVVFTIHYNTVPDTRETFDSPPVVSDGGFIWFTTNNPQGEVHLICLDSSGTQQAHALVTLQAGGNPTASPFYLATDSNDQCYLVLKDCVQAFATDGTLLWTHGTSASWVVGFKTAVVGDDGLIYVGNWFGSTIVIEALSHTDGSVDHSFDTGVSSGRPNQFAMSGTSIYIPFLVTGNPGITKFKTDGTPDWTSDFSTIGVNGYRFVDTCPSISGSHVLCMGGTDNVTGFNGAVSIADSDGAFQWEYQNIDVEDADTPAVDAGGQVYVLIGNNTVGPILAALDITNGSELWRYTSTGRSDRGVAPSVGNDNTLLVITGSPVGVARVDTSDGSELSVLSVTDGTYSPALALANSLIPDLSTPGVLSAYGIVIPDMHIFPNGGEPLTLAGNSVEHGVLGHLRFPNTGSNLPVSSPGGAALADVSLAEMAAFLLYTAGEVDGSFYADGTYGQPTLISINNPVVGKVYIVDVPIADPSGFAQGVTGQVKIKREGSAPDHYSGSVAVSAVEIYGNSVNSS